MESRKISIIDAIGSSELKEILFDAGEFGLDLLIEDETLSDIPFLGSAAKLYKAAEKVKEKVFLRKIQKFLSELFDLTEEERNSFIENLEKSKNGKEKAGEAILYLMDSIDEDEKASFIGKIFRAAADKRINIELMYRLTHIVKNTYIDDLRCIKYYRNDNPLHIRFVKAFKDPLISTGIMARNVKVDTKLNYKMNLGSQSSGNTPPSDKLDVKNETKMTDIGLILAEILYGVLPFIGGSAIDRYTK